MSPSDRTASRSMPSARARRGSRHSLWRVPDSRLTSTRPRIWLGPGSMGSEFRRTTRSSSWDLPRGFGSPDEGERGENMTLEIGAVGQIMPPVEGLLKTARRNEEKGFDAIWWPDHLMG